MSKVMSKAKSSSATVEMKPKRKRSESKELSKKRAKSENSNDENPEEQILLDEQSILESKKNYNKILNLISIAQQGQDGGGLAVVAAVSLCRVFIQLLAAGSLTMKKGLSDKDRKVVEWLKGNLSQYEEVLLQLLGREELAITALTLALRLLKSEGLYISDKDEYSFPRAFLTKIVKVLLYSETGDDVRQEFVEKYVQEYQDIRFFSFQAIEVILKAGQETENTDTLFENAFAILYNTDQVPGDKEKFENFYLPAPKKKKHDLFSVPQLRKNAQGAWLALMGLASKKAQRKQLLDCMVREIAPWFVNPERLSDFMTDCYNTGGSMSLLALSGVFYLIQERNLDYPSFYTKLYSLLTVEMLHSKHRSKFLRLLETFLASSHLPAILVASFIKRLSRLSISAPPSAIVAIVPYLYNLFKKHPQTTFMMHRVIGDLEVKRLVEEEGFEDPFDPEETDPMETNAIDSCIWEIVQLQTHYHPNVSTIANIVSEQFTKQSYNTEDFLDHSYQSLIDAELSKEVKKKPVVEFFVPDRVFSASKKEEVNKQESMLVKLWNFS
ncbi:hypothetical protein MKZ38_006273 [Zalerion maritima]|uniref:CCAAT-binding factor domain-containing protein n=1 Tax=Zalerion maritima TaxID=339359 RepID=A0AAD5WQE6_9PEZI|nr:hypothetical protein MKZ38_006273 [Zalerion maritima]